MAFHDKFKLIRESKGLTQADVAAKMGVSEEYINNLETMGSDVHDGIIAELKIALSLEDDTPFTRKEMEFLRSNLKAWCMFLNQALIDGAMMQQPNLEARVMKSFDAEAKALYALFSTAYYRIIGDNDAMKKALDYVEANIKNLPANQAYNYLAPRANAFMRNSRYKEALRDLIYVEYLCEQLNFKNHVLYYNIAICCNELGYFYKVKEYIDKARKQADESNKEYNAMHFDVLEAMSYRDAARYDSAFNILHERLDVEKRNLAGNPDIHMLYCNIGYAHLGLKEYDKAIKLFDSALKHCDKNNAYYIYYLYYKSLALLLSGDIENYNEYLQEGLSIAAPNGIHATLFNALNHSRTIENEESLAYIKNVAIPFFIKVGKHREVAKYYEKVSKFYAKVNEIELSIEYNEMTRKYNRKMTKGELKKHLGRNRAINSKSKNTS